MPEDLYRLPVRSIDSGDRRSHSVAPSPDHSCFRMPLFRPGTRVGYKGSLCTVSHVLISRGELLVYLQETKDTVNADTLILEPSRLATHRI